MKKPKTVSGIGGGKIITNITANLPGYGRVWYAPSAPTNILSFRSVLLQFHISYDENRRMFELISREEMITKKDNDRKVRRFVMQQNGLHIYMPHAQRTFSHTKPRATVSG